jgi:hypothetical protein
MTESKIKTRDWSGALAVYDGRRYCGFVRESDGDTYMAIDARGIQVGERFRTQSAAIGAISSRRRRAVS